jgi:hypothetical protein
MAGKKKISEEVLKNKLKESSEKIKGKHKHLKIS